MATKPTRIYSADDVLYLTLPPDVSGYELVDGELVEVMPAGQLHSLLAGEVYTHVRNHVKDRGIRGQVHLDVGYVLGLQRDPQRLRGPDVSFVTPETLQRLGAESEHGFLHGAPDLAVEVESAERPKHLQQRIQDYLDAGTRLVWVIHSLTKSATVYHPDGSARLLRESDALEGEDVLPGLRIALSELFES
ncbi:MAG: Uma2 family endonuclease [Gemmatimonadota bacterium]